MKPSHSLRSRWGRPPNPRPSRRWALAAAVGAAIAGALSLVHCARGPADAPPECSCSDAGAPVVDATLLAFLGKVRSAHHQADLHQDEGDLDLAIAALEPVVTAAHPPSPEAVEVIADTRARLADLRSDLGHYDAALADVDAGLALAAEPSHFRGHLLEMRGVVLERRFHAQEAAGEQEAAERSKADALEAFKRAIEVQDRVIDEALQHVGH
jgi:tetratricopeptide (TPR) repeat protein